MSKAKILLVDDDAPALDSTRKILELGEYEVVTAVDGQDALDRVRAIQLSALDPTRSRLESFDLIVTDVRMPRLGGLEFLRALSLCGDGTPVILMTAFGRVEEAVWAMKFGAVDFLTKPFKRQALLSSVEMALKRARAHARGHSGIPGSAGPSAAATGRQPIERILVGASAPMRRLHSEIRQVAPTLATVLIAGESGTGKELVARRIHDESQRIRKDRFIALNCAAFPEQLIESELFGYEKGAFTGATQAREGLFEAAHDGTLFLDEIGDMPVILQAKLLRVLQEGEVRRIGATLSRKVSVRVIAATHRDLKESVKAGTFRQDLLYRLEVVSLRICPLRERPEDIPDLAYHFLRIANDRHGKRLEGFVDEAMEALLAHAWPGNVRELANVIERAVIFARGGSILPEDLPAHLLPPEAAGKSCEMASRSGDASTSADPASGSQLISVPLGTPLREVEDLLIRKTLEATSGDKNMTARLLGINSRTIYRKLGEKSRQGSGNERVIDPASNPDDTPEQ